MLTREKIRLSLSNVRWLRISLGLIVFVFGVALSQVLIETLAPDLNSPIIPVGMSLLLVLLVVTSKVEFSITFLLIGLSIFLSDQLHDVYFDGITYHQSGIYWVSSNYHPLFPEVQDRWELFVNHYPKLSWLYGSAFLGPMGSVSMAKSINFILFFAVFTFAGSTLKGHLATKLILGLLMAANPIAMNQIFSGYVDGLIAQFIALAAIAILRVRLANLTDDIGWILALSIIALPALKFTGILFAGVLTLATALIIWLRHRRTVEHQPPSAFAVFQFGGVVSLIALTLLANPYLSNLLQGKHLLHPAFGSSKLSNLISGQTTPEFYELHPTQKLLVSIASRSYDLGPWSSVPLPPLKQPFTFSISEIEQFAAVDTRAGGWGPIFFGVLVLTLLLVVLSIKRGLLSPEALVLLIALTASVLLNPESWWARYSPQLALIPPLTIFAIFQNGSKVFETRSGLIRVTSSAVTLLALLNSSLTFLPMVENSTLTNQSISQQLAKIRAASPTGIVVWDKQQMNLEAFLESGDIIWRAPIEGETPTGCIEIYLERFCLPDVE